MARPRNASGSMQSMVLWNYGIMYSTEEVFKLSKWGPTWPKQTNLATQHKIMFKFTLFTAAA